MQHGQVELSTAAGVDTKKELLCFCSSLPQHYSLQLIATGIGVYVETGRALKGRSSEQGTAQRKSSI